MGQRLDRPATAPTPTSGGVAAASGSTTSSGAVHNANSSLSTTFSSSSASSTSSSSSSSSTVNNNNTITPNNNADNAAASRSSHGSRHHHHHRRHVHRPRGSVPDAHQAPTSSSSLANMSPRTRFRTEMARRGYTNSSSDLFFRLFQFPSSTLMPAANSSGQEAATAPAAGMSSPTSTEVSVTPARPVPPPPSSSGGGLSAFRFFNLGSLGSSANNHELDSDLSSDEDEPHWNHNMSSLAQSLPFFFGMRDFKCFVCNKVIPADDVEAHIMMCLTKPRLTYNEDVLTDAKGECIICFEELEKGQTIARLQCLCIYHKHCIENWLKRSQSCPGHPPD